MIQVAAGVQVEIVRPIELDLPPGIQPDMTEHGFDRDDWQAMAADILVLGIPIWLWPALSNA